jgi:hypothetical protein
MTPRKVTDYAELAEGQTVAVAPRFTPARVRATRSYKSGPVHLHVGGWGRVDQPFIERHEVILLAEAECCGECGRPK